MQPGCRIHRSTSRAARCELTVLHVFDPAKVYYHAGDLALRPQDEILKDLVTVRRQKLNQFVADHFVSIPLEPRFATGDPMEQIGRMSYWTARATLLANIERCICHARKWSS